jgi:hypothetical protein
MEHQITVIGVVCLILFAVYRRVRRNFGWQKLNAGRLGFRIALLTVIGLLFMGQSVVHPVSLISDLAGIAIGAAIAYYGASVTEFEKRDGGLHYRPNMWVGTAVTVIFLGRLAYRFYAAYSQAGDGGFASMQFGASNNSWASGLILIMFAYYITYYLILLAKQRRVPRGVA